MSRLRVECFSVSLDGYGAGPNQCREHPLGVGGPALHEWSHGTRTFQKRVMGNEGGESGVGEQFVARGFENVGAWILGRNMFGPVRGPWPDEEWNGWWGDDPPYHTHVFVLTHHPRTSRPSAASRACSSAAWMPPVTNRNSVPPFIVKGSRA